MKRLLILSTLVVSSLADGQTILWNSDAGAQNQCSNGQPMDADFRFELGVFQGSFVPTTTNLANWSENWRAGQRISYDANIKRFASSFTPTNNDSPFTIGKPTYIWGFRGDSLSSEWILFRATNWSYPDADPLIPLPPIEWFAKNATPVLGAINASGSPFLMKSAAVTFVTPPRTLWSQWQSDFLTGEPLNGPNQDPDNDGIPNLIEFVFGSPPKVAGPPPVTPVAMVESEGQKFLQITIPRRRDRLAVLTVEVSENLVSWNNGSAYTTVVQDDAIAQVVRDLTPIDGLHPSRFMRLKASLP